MTVANAKKAINRDNTLSLHNRRTLRTICDELDPSAVSLEGTNIKSTGEVGGSKFLREDGDGTSSWQALPASGAFEIDADTQITPSTPIVLDHASNNEVALSLDYTTNKAAGNDTGLLISMTDTASPGTSYLADFKVGATSQFYVRNNGFTLVNGTLQAQGGLRVLVGQAVSNASAATLTLSHWGFSAADDICEVASGTHTPSSGQLNALVVNPTYDASGTSAATDLLINRTETNVGSGAQYLADFQVGGVSKAHITSGGKLVLDPAGAFGTSTGVWFGDGDTGFYESSDDNLDLYLGGSRQWRISSANIRTSDNTKLLLANTLASATVPNVCTGGSNDADTGVGHAAADQLSLIAGGVEGMRVEEGNNGTVGAHLLINDLTTAPTGNATGGGYLFSEAGALKWRGSSGTVTTIAVA